MVGRGSAVVVFKVIVEPQITLLAAKLVISPLINFCGCAGYIPNPHFVHRSIELCIGSLRAIEHVSLRGGPHEAKACYAAPKGGALDDGSVWHAIYVNGCYSVIVDRRYVVPSSVVDGSCAAEINRPGIGCYVPHYLPTINLKAPVRIRIKRNKGSLVSGRSTHPSLYRDGCLVPSVAHPIDSYVVVDTV